MGDPTVKPVAPAATAATETGVDVALAPAAAGAAVSLQPVINKLAATRAAKK